MPVLDNPRHEAFAQHLANMPKTGMSQREAYFASGYRCTVKSADEAACVLSSQPKVKQRVAELLRPVVRKTQRSMGDLALAAREIEARALADGHAGLALQSLALQAKILDAAGDSLHDYSSCNSADDVFARVLANYGQRAANALQVAWATYQAGEPALLVDRASKPDGANRDFNDINGLADNSNPSEG